MELRDQIDQDQADWSLRKRSPDELETLSLRELFPYWSNLLWKESLRPLIQKMYQIDLTMSESQILRHLRHHSLAISEVAEHLAITHSAASRAVDRLVRDGFVSRIENPADRRQKQLQLTKTGAEQIQILNDTLSGGVQRLVASLPREEQEQFRLLVSHIIAAYSDAADSSQTNELPV